VESSAPFDFGAGVSIQNNFGTGELFVLTPELSRFWPVKWGLVS
jgi:hypothetical protein